MKPASQDSILTASLMQLPKTTADTVETMKKELAAMHDSSRMAPVFIRLSKLWERNKMLPAAAFYRAKAAKLENSGKSLTFAGQIFLQLMENEQNPSMQMWEAGEAISVLEKAQSIDPANEDAKLALAAVYIEGSGEPMKGVQMLLAITREKPDDVPANLLLGRMSIKSGQWEKAVKRFETVLAKEPNNKEALYFAAQAYEGAGNKKKAIEALEQVKKVVNNPEFSKDIDNHINSLK
jgi:tetratricopeptide (TPR) repeat protein